MRLGWDIGFVEIMVLGDKDLVRILDLVDRI